MQVTSNSSWIQATLVMTGLMRSCVFADVVMRILQLVFIKIYELDAAAVNYASYLLTTSAKTHILINESSLTSLQCHNVIDNTITKAKSLKI